MSDVCCLTIIFRKDELKKFNEVLKDQIHNETFWDNEYTGETEIVATIYEANYGWQNELQELTEAGLTFHGDHAEGGDYGSCTFASYGGEYQEVPTNRDACPVVAIGEDLQVAPSDLDDIKKYWELNRKAEKYIERQKEDITSA